jgi:hypothetical protein
VISSFETFNSCLDHSIEDKKVYASLVNVTTSNDCSKNKEFREEVPVFNGIFNSDRAEE